MSKRSDVKVSVEIWRSTVCRQRTEGGPFDAAVQRPRVHRGRRQGFQQRVEWEMPAQERHFLLLLLLLLPWSWSTDVNGGVVGGHGGGELLLEFVMVSSQKRWKRVRWGRRLEKEAGICTCTWPAKIENKELSKNIKINVNTHEKMSHS